SWNHVNLPIAQMYHVTVDDQIPYFVYGNRQDGPSWRGPSNSLQFGGFSGNSIPRGARHPVAGGESGFAVPDPVDNNIIWSTGTGSGSIGGTVTRFDERPHQDREVVVCSVTCAAKEPGLIGAGTNDGQVQVTRDGGKNWTNVTKNLPKFPEWGTVDNIEASRYDAGTAYLTVDGHQVNFRDPFVYKTADYGKTWTLITNGIPHNMLSYAHCVREDPVRKRLLYLGTEGGLYVS